MTNLFSPSEVKRLHRRALPQPTSSPVSLSQLDGAVLIGGGVYTRMLLPHLQCRGIRPAWIADSDAKRWGAELEGIPIRAPENLAHVGDQIVIAMTHHFRAMADVIERYKVRRWAWFTDIREVFGGYRLVATLEEVTQQPEIDRLAGLLAHSPESLHVLERALSCRVTGDAADFPPPTPAQYFQDDIVGGAGFHWFVDCGAWAGDTLQEWVRRHGRAPFERLRYHAIEPDPQSFHELKAAHDELPPELRSRVTLHPCAVGEKEGSIALVSGGVTTMLREGLDGAATTPVVRLDRLLAGEPVGAVKMDLEGFEPHALEGARDLIQSQRPALLIAIYHQVSHLWELPLWIHDLGLGYRLHLRHHDASMSETVCYGVPPA